MFDYDHPVRSAEGSAAGVVDIRIVGLGELTGWFEVCRVDVAAEKGRRTTAGSAPIARANPAFDSPGVYAPEHGIVASTVPGMADFIRRQPDP